MRFTIFQEGHPGYKKPLDAEIVEARNLTRLEFERNVSRFLFMTTEEIKAIQKDPKTTMLEHLIISILGKAAKDGDQKRLNMILDRVIGPVLRSAPMYVPPSNPEGEYQQPQGVTIDVTKISDSALKELMYAGTTAANK